MNWLLSSWSSFNNERNLTETTNVFCWDVAQVTAVLKQKSGINNLLCLLVNSIITNLEIQIDDKKKRSTKLQIPEFAPLIGVWSAPTLGPRKY